MIVDGLASLSTPLDVLALLDGNPRRGDVDAIARSLDTFGQRKPVVARADGTVIAGNHTVQAARKLGWTHVAVVYVNDDDTTAHAYALADNRTAELGTYDDAELAALISSVHDADAELLASTGWSPTDLEDLLAKLDDVAAEDAKGTLLPEIDVTLGDPKREVERGDVWLVGDHTLVVADVMTDHASWIPHLTGDALFVPYPGPLLPLSVNATKRMVMVQPDAYLAGHLLDACAAAWGDETVARK